MTITDEERPLPALFGHCEKVYTEMENQAEREPVDDEEQLVYTGALTGLFAGLGVPNPYYTHVMRALKKMGCVHQLRRGGGTAPSKWMLVAPPTEDAFTDLDGSYTDWKGKRGGKVASLEQQIRDVTRRVSVLEDLSAAR
jgi:hypothetical protein